ncbi:MAG: hypothetical protein AB198_02550 [Parcubacteria bacterium C7867-003]|nr:MAG: hypothetical protein AB198_02550 [Parcubacteria bacterium C7867-003]
MKKTLLMGVFALLLSTGAVFADSSVNYPSTFSLKVGEKVNIANYQNMQIEFVKVGTSNGDCVPSSNPCPLGNPVNLSYPETVRKSVEIKVSTAGGCGPDADSRCLGAPAYSQTFTIGDGGSVKALAVKIKVSSIMENSATFSVSANVDDSTDGDKDDDTTIKPLPPVPVIKVTSVSSGQGTINRVDKIIICPNGDAGENCSVCSNGDCRPETTPASPRKLGEPVSSNGSPVLQLRGDESLVSAVKVESTDDSKDASVAYEVKAKRKARLLFLFPVNPEITYTVTATGSSTVSSRPWWNFLAW